MVGAVCHAPIRLIGVCCRFGWRVAERDQQCAQDGGEVCPLAWAERGQEVVNADEPIITVRVSSPGVRVYGCPLRRSVALPRLQAVIGEVLPDAAFKQAGRRDYPYRAPR